MLRLGKTSSIEAEVWWIPDDDTPGEPSHLEGPYIHKTQTLTAHYPFRPAKFAERDAWKAVIPEPVLWSPRTPAFYQISGTEHVIAIRELRIKRDSFYQESRRWVIRGAFANTMLLDNSLKANDLVPIYDSKWLGGLARQAVILGYPAIFDCREPTADLIDAVSQSAAILMALVPTDCPRQTVQAAHSHLLLGTRVERETRIPDWAHFVTVREGLLRDGWKPDRRLPVVATREWDVQNHSPAQLRGVCDSLQADLDRGADYAGLWLLAETTS